MASIYNLKRNSRVFFTTNVNATDGKVKTSGFTSSNTQELSVLDGFSFTQTTTAAAITLSEAGSSPTRGQRSFNTALNPVDFSFSTYIRPYTSNVSAVDADEGDLWNAIFGVADTSTTGIGIAYTGTLSATYASSTGVLTVSAATVSVSGAAVDDIYTLSGITGSGASLFNAPVKVTSIYTTAVGLTYLTAPATGSNPVVPVASGTWKLEKKSWISNTTVTGDTITAAYAEVSTARSNSNTLLKFGLIIIADGITYTIDNCVIDQASIDFGLDGIATVAWTGKGIQLNQLAGNISCSSYGTTANPVVQLNGAYLTDSGTSTAAGKSDTAYTKFLTNKLSTVTLDAQIGGGGTSYNMALTGGTIQIANNVNYITPNSLGVLNIPIGYYTGTRAITGTLNAYLKTGTNNTADLLKKVLTDSTAGATELKYKLGINIGGTSSAATRIEVLINGASLQIPTVDAGQDVISTAIQFTAQGTDNIVGTTTANYDVGATNDLRIRYFAA